MHERFCVAAASAARVVAVASDKPHWQQHEQLKASVRRTHLRHR